MRTTVDLPDDLFRRAKARAALQGRPVKDIVADGLKLLLKSPQEASSPAPIHRPAVTAFGVPERKRGSAGAWAKRFTGIARLAHGETTDDARLDHYRKKHGF